MGDTALALDVFVQGMGAAVTASLLLLVLWGTLWFPRNGG